MFRKRRSKQPFERRKVGARCLLEPLEPRILFSADPLSASVEGLIPSALDDSNTMSSEGVHKTSDSVKERLEVSNLEQEAEQQESSPTQLIVIDTSTPDYQRLLSDVTQGEGADFQVLLLATDQNGVDQITQYLGGYGAQSFSAIHIISHGSDGAVQLGSLNLNESTLANQRDALSSWQDVLTDDADLLFYGCNLAQQSEGQQLLQTISELTRADIAASDDLTGASALNGDWELEFLVGEVGSELFLSTAFEAGWQHTLGPFGAVDSLWLNSKDGATGLSIPGIPSITKAQLLELSDPNLSFEPAGTPSQTTDGTLTSIIDMNLFDLTNGDIKIDAMHYVSADITIGQSTTIDLKAGDILMSSGDGNETLTSNNVQDVKKGDVFVFRPTVINDYSSGDFFILFDKMVTTDLRAISLVETDTVVGGTVLTKGSLIYSQATGGSFDDKSIYIFNPIDVGESNTSGVYDLLIDGGDVGIDENIHGLELIETNTTIAGTSLAAGTILMSQNNGDVIGSNDLSVSSGDVALLKITQATVGGASPVAAEATAALFFDGSDVGLAGVKLDGISLISVVQNTEPVVVSTALDPTYIEDSGGVAVFTATSIDVVDAGQNVKGIALVVENASDGVNEQIIIDGSVIALLDGATGTTTDNGFDYEVTLNGASYTLVLKNGSITAADAQTMIDGLRYNSVDQNPNAVARVITLKSLTDTGGIASGGDDTVDLNISSTVAMVAVNDAPTADATALDPVFSEGDAATSLFSGADIRVIEAGQLITAMTFTVTNVESLSSEKLRLDGTDVVLLHGQTGTTATNSLGYSVSISAGTATITLSGGTLTDALANTLLNTSAYINSAQNPVAGVKSVSLIEIVDSGGTANGGIDVGSFALTSSVTVVDVNDEPVVTGTGNDPSFVAGGSAVTPFSGIDIDLIESTQTVSGFVIEVSNVFDGSNEKIQIDGSTIILINSSSGTTSGSGFSYDVSVSGPTRTITFTGGSASAVAVESLLNAMTYQNDNGALTEATRTISLIALSDSGGTANGGDDTATLAIASDVSVIRVNAEPTFSATASNPTFIASGGAVAAFESAAIDAQNPGQTISGLTFTISGLLDGGNEKIVLDGSTISLMDAASGTTATNAISYSVSEAGGVATVTLTGANLTDTNAENLVNNIAYLNDAAIPSVGVRLIELTGLTDSGGTANAGDDTVAVSIQSSIDVQAVNIEPSVNANPVDPSFTENGAAVSLFSSTVVDLVESGQLVVSLSFSITNVFDGSDEVISFDGTDIALTAGNSGFTAGNAMSFTVTEAANFATISFNSSGLEPSLTETLINGMSYNNTSEDPNVSDRVVTLTHLQDSGGVANGGDDSVSPAIATTVTVAAANDQPTVSAVAIAADEDGVVVNGSFVVNDEDAGDTHVFAIVGSPSEGSVINNNDGTFSFDPGPDFQDLAAGQTRDVSFTYRATDNSGAGNADSALATVTVTVTGANDQPLATGFDINADEDGAVVSSSFIETDADTNDTHVFSITSSPAEGTVVNNNDGTFSFDPGSDFQDLAEGATRVVSFDYVVTDSSGSGNANSVSATVTVTVTGRNETPIVGNLTQAANEDGVVVNGNFSVVDGDGADTHTFVIVDAPVEGSVVNNNDGSFSFDPAGDFQDLAEGETRDVTFTYRAIDSSSTANDTSSLATVRITVTGVNDRPVIASFVVNSAEDNGPKSASFSVSDADLLDTQTIVVLSAPAEGNIVNNNDGTFTFDPGTDFQDLAQGESRNVSVSYQSTDDSGAVNDTSTIETITFTVAGTNDRPTVSGVFLSAIEDGALAGGSFNVTDVDSNDSHTFVITGAPAQGVATNNGDGTFSFDVGSDFQELSHGEVRTVVFTFAAVDGSGVASSTSANGAVTVDVVGTNDRPIVRDMSVSLNSSDSELVDAFDFTEIDLSDTSAVTIIEQPSNGSLVDLGNGAFRFVPDSSFDDLAFGESSFVTAKFQVSDDSGQSNDTSREGTITIEVKGNGFVIVDPVAPPVTAPVTEPAVTPGPDETAPAELDSEATAPETSPEQNEAENTSDSEESSGESDAGFSGDAVGERLSDVGEAEGGESLFDGAFTGLNVSVNNAEIIQSTTEFERADANLAGAISIESVESLRVKFAVYSDPLSLVETERYMRGVDDIRDELKQSSDARDTTMGGMLSVSAGLSAGYVVWLARSGILLSSVLSSLPAWRFIDPLPVLGGVQGEGADDDESLEEMVTSSESDEADNVEEDR
ncbi:MAG: DUF4347 domain-containing protein [Cellvibrionaceae bacterium]